MNSSDYCTSIPVTSNVRLNLFTNNMFRVRRSELSGEPFPNKYQIPFAIGHLDNWPEVSYSTVPCDNGIAVRTATLEIRVKKDGVWSVHELSDISKKIYPNEAPVFGLCKGGCIMFDSASAHGRPSNCCRYAHWFYSHDTNTYTDIFLEENKIMDEFFIYGPDYLSLFFNFHELTGKAPLPSRKNFGFMQTQHLSEAGTQQKLLDVAARMRKENLPCDTLIIDFEWGDAGEPNRPDWGSPSDWGSSLKWQSNYTKPMTPKEMISHLKETHFDVALIHHSCPIYPSHKMVAWTSNTYPPEIWWGAIERDLSMGIIGTWQDTRRVDPANSLILKGLRERMGEGHRPFLLANRDTIETINWNRVPGGSIANVNWIGAHRNGIYWSGDIDFTWKELRWQIEAITGSEGSLSGFPYFNSDSQTRNWRLQARWHQFTHLIMFSRNHTMKPWNDNQEAFIANFERFFRFDNGSFKESENEQTTNETFAETPIDWSQSSTDAIRDALNLRYRLLPFIYSLAIQQYVTGMPPLRPLLLAFPDDTKCNLNQWPRQYLMGAELLFAPVCTPDMSMEIYLPAGETWIDFWNNRQYVGGQTITCDVSDIRKWPIFVRAGSIIPTTKPAQWINELEPWEPLIFEIWPGKPAENILHEDDGVSMSYETGEIASTAVRFQTVGPDLNVTIEPTNGKYNGQPLTRKCAVNFNCCKQKPTQVILDGAELKLQEGSGEKPDYLYDPVVGSVIVKFTMEHLKRHFIEVKFSENNQNHAA